MSALGIKSEFLTLLFTVYSESLLWSSGRISALKLDILHSPGCLPAVSVCLCTPHSESSPQPWLCLRPLSSLLFASILKPTPPSCTLRCPASRDSFACFHWEKFPFSLNPQYDAVHGIMAFVISPRGGTIWRGKPVQLLWAWTLEPNHLDSDPGSDAS